MSRAEVLQHRTKVQALEKHIEQNGQQLVLHTLTEQGMNPLQSIISVQNELSLGSKRAAGAFILLDFLKAPRTTIHTTALDKLKESLLLRIQRMNEANLLVMLRETCRFMAVDDLKTVPVAILKKLTRIPDKYLQYLVEKDYIMEFPIAVRRQAWSQNLNYFLTAVANVWEPARNSASRLSGHDNAAVAVAEMIGASDELFSAFADHCAAGGDGHEDLPERLLLVSVELIQRKLRASASDRFCDAVSLINRCRRQRRVDSNDVTLLVGVLRFLVTAQAAALAKEHPDWAARDEKERGAAAPASSSSSSSSSKKRKQQPDAGTGSCGDDSAAARQSDAVRRGLQFLADLDADGVFLDRVSDSIAPGYSRLVVRPMCRRDMLRKARSGQYRHGLADLDSDVQLMLRNCVQYNGSDSSYGQLAARYKAEWLSFLKTYSGREDGSDEKATVVTASPPAAASGKFSKVLRKVGSSLEERGLARGERSRRVLHCALDHMAAADTFKLFAEPVSDKLVPGYSRVVRRKMAFSDVRRKILAGEYDGLRCVGADMALIFDNCALFNRDNAPILAEGERLRAEWLSLVDSIQTHFPQLADGTAGHTSAVDSGEGIGRDVSEGDSACQSSEMSEWSADQERDAADVARRLAVERASSQRSLQSELMLLWDFLSRLDQDGLFSAPVQAEGYLSVVATPMDLGTMRKRIDRNKYSSVQSFAGDVELVVDNCRRFNKADSAASKAAARLERGLARIIGALSEADRGSAPPGALDNSEDRAEDTECAALSLYNGKGRGTASKPEDDETVPYNVAPTVTQDSSTAVSADVYFGNTVSAAVSGAVQGGTAGSVTGKLDSLALWRSSRAASSAVQSAHSALRHSTGSGGPLAAHTLLDLPEVLLDSRLLWAATVLRENVFRGLMVAYLAKRLLDRTESAMASGADFRGQAPLPPLPHDDSHLRAAFQLCQYSFGSGNVYVFRALDEWLWRVFVPRLVCQVLVDGGCRQDEQATAAPPARDTKMVDLVAGYTARGPDASAVISANRGLLEEILLQLRSLAR